MEGDEDPYDALEAGWGQVSESDQALSEEESLALSDEEADYEAPIEDWYNEDESDYGHEPGREEPEPEPPDHNRDHPSYKKWYEEEEEEEEDWEEQDYEENNHREESLTEDDESQGGYREAAGREEQNPKQPDHTGSLRWSIPPKTFHAPKSMVYFNSNYYPTNELKLYKFSGKRNYLEWERNIDEWFYYNKILKEQRLDYAIGQLTGNAYEWWLQEEDDRWFYKEPSITTWGDLKSLLRDMYAPKDLVPKIREIYPRSFDIRKVDKPAPQANANTIKDQGKSTVFKQLLDLTCYRCKNRGHIAKDCPRKKELEKKIVAKSLYNKQVNKGIPSKRFLGHVKKS